MNVLFVCSRNKWRSLTAETIFKDSQQHAVRSAGTAVDARIKVSEKLVRWADIIFVMEKRHRERLQEKFREEIVEKEVVVLDIPDDYQYMDAELIAMLEKTVAPFVDF